MRFIALKGAAWLVAALLAPVVARSGEPDEGHAGRDVASMEQLARQMEMRGLERQRAEAAEQRYAAWRQQEIYRHLGEFAEAWNAFVRDYVEGGVLPAAKARKVRKAWRTLEKDELWPK